ncbi:MAG: hypothetical protein BWX44_00923 [Spirochaetes bacterium ADurb.Bin001]|nr:MAG: hypothetical protein BWX44_00923 [Spirochaetes bacterium ADurb.Bin001]
MALCSEVVDFVGLELFDEAYEIRAISEIAVMQHKQAIGFMRVGIDVVDALCIKARAPSLNTMDAIAFFKE